MGLGPGEEQPIKKGKEMSQLIIWFLVSNAKLIKINGLNNASVLKINFLFKL